MIESVLVALKGSIHVVSSALLLPTIIILLLFLAVTIFELGGLIVEACVERRKPKVRVAELVEDWRRKSAAEITAAIVNSPLSGRQKEILTHLNRHAALPAASLRALARQLLTEEELRFAKTTNRTDTIARLGPMFGLMATLIPLGPGMIALGQGDTKMLADSLLTAFDATVSGLAAAGVAYAISRLRKTWYEGDLNTTEALLECLTEVITRGRGLEAPQEDI